MKFGTQAKLRVGSSFAALLLAAGSLGSAVSAASPTAAASQEAQTALRVSVTDAVTGRPLQDVALTLYWADTASNRANGRTPGQAVAGTVSASTSADAGLSERWIEPGDYAIVGEKAGYLPFDSRTAKPASSANARQADGAAVRAAGSGPIAYAFALTPARHTYPAYMNGYTDGTFRPEQNLIRAELAVILQRTMSAEASPSGADFRDIAPDKWLTAGVSLAAAKGWMQGTGGARFEPERDVTRAEMAQILANVYAWPTTGPESAFGDTRGHWASAAIAAAAANGAMDGYPDGNFRPDRPVTRAETAALLNRLIERPADAGLPMTWSDVPPSYWAYGDVMAASLDHTPSKAR